MDDEHSKGLARQLTIRLIVIVGHGGPSPDLKAPRRDVLAPRRPRAEFCPDATGRKRKCGDIRRKRLCDCAMGTGAMS